ncbi:MAG TPA: Sir2 family NAD-dependent protein deacetylase [Acidimicrobiales bacterium]|nr:Sir2 family NAD-dependent protein deacetylase [Acidimicrobiales bacterium]
MASKHRPDDQVTRARDLVAGSVRTVVLTGAGISTESGIPDFRGPDGLWTKDPEAEKLATLADYLADPSVRIRAWRQRLDSPTWSARPNAGHRALVDLERRGTLDTLVTQNVDGLHIAAGHDPALVIEIHGTMRDTICLRCGDRRPMGETLRRVRAGEQDPECRTAAADGPCGGTLKSATISFGQSLVAEDLARAESAARHCDLLLAVGSSLSVYPAAGLVPLAAHHGAPIVIVNGEATDYDDMAEAVVRQPIGEALQRIVG